MVRVDLDGILIVSDGLAELLLLPEGKATVVVEVGFGRLEFYGLGEATNGLVVVTSSVERYAFVVVGVRVLRVNLYCLRVVLDSLIEPAQLVVGEASVEQSFEVGREDVESLRVEIYGRLIVTLLPRFVALSVQFVSLSLLLLVLQVFNWNGLVVEAYLDATIGHVLEVHALVD